MGKVFRISRHIYKLLSYHQSPCPLPAERPPLPSWFEDTPPWPLSDAACRGNPGVSTELVLSSSFSAFTALNPNGILLDTNTSTRRIFFPKSHLLFISELLQGPMRQHKEFPRKTKAAYGIMGKSARLTLRTFRQTRLSYVWTQSGGIIFGVRVVFHLHSPFNPFLVFGA